MSRLGSGWHFFRERGVISTVRAIIDRYVCHSEYHIVTYSVLTGPPAPDHVGNVAFRLATLSDFDQLGELWQYGAVATHRTYVEKDSDWLFVACDGERIVATRRVSRLIRDNVISRVIQLNAEQVWGADLFCLPEYRNRGIGRGLKIFGDRHLASLGYHELFGSMLPSNTPSHRSSAAAGRRPLYFVSLRRVLGWQRLRVSKNIPHEYADSWMPPKEPAASHQAGAR